MSAGHGRLPFPWPRWGCRYGQGGQGRRGSAGLGDATLAQVPPLPLGISPRCVPGPPPYMGWGGILAQWFGSTGEERAGQDPTEFSTGGNQESPACLV